MKTNKKAAYKRIAQLVERFSEHVEEYKRNCYNEHQTRVDYINPFFKALGWDMDNEQGFAEAYREVIHEDKVKVGSSTKAPDYGFTLFGQRKFFVDAKKPAVNIKGDIAPAYQVRRYGWSAKVPISIVTDFEEFSVYDCTKKPKPTDKASVARIKYTTYDQYLDEFDFLWDVFAKENLPKGRFDKYVQSDTRRKGTATVDDEFLKSIEQWRTYLATTIALRNKSLNEDEINYAVQKIIDRIIFLRMCEDRGVEQYGNLKKAAEKGDIYQNLFTLYRRADDKYNSGLFDFKEDKITPALTVDDKVVKTIIKELYYPDCEYEFSVMPADILGSVYERFLGKTIRLTKAHHAKIEEKPEVRKAGGVYYTPKYIVDYIVENTVGKLIKGKKAKDVEKIRICDPACGSGSFLIGAYQYLLDWHLKYYADNPPKKKKDAPLTPDGNLTTAEKKRILLNNIFGVDIDAQAVEVTKLNLLLKALEGETQASISQQLTLFHERVLPNLGSNIKCGNSLIGPDFYDDRLDLFPEQMKKINAFDWNEGFPEIIKQGGFDTVIGNPPYVDSRVNESNAKDYWKMHYVSSKYGKTNSYEVFIERGLQLLKKSGELGFIVPIVLLRLEACKALREFILKKYSIIAIAYGDFPVFADANVDTAVILLATEHSKRKIKGEVLKLSEEFATIIEKHILDLDDSNSSNDYKISLKNDPISKRLAKQGELYDSLSSITDFYNGIATGPNKEKYFANKRLSKDYKPLLMGNNVGYYYYNHDGRHINYDREKLHRPRKEFIFLADEKIIMQRIRNLKLDRRLVCTLDTEKFYTFNSVNNLLLKKNSQYDIRYVLALLNSKLLNYLLKQKSLNTNITLSDLDLLPIKSIDFNSSEKEKHDQITKLVDKLLKLNIQLQATKLETQRQQIQRTIAHTEKKVDELVYGLYGLNKEEIEIIENST